MDRRVSDVARVRWGDELTEADYDTALVWLPEAATILFRNMDDGVITQEDERLLLAYWVLEEFRALRPRTRRDRVVMFCTTFDDVRALIPVERRFVAPLRAYVPHVVLNSPEPLVRGNPEGWADLAHAASTRPAADPVRLLSQHFEAWWNGTRTPRAPAIVDRSAFLEGHLRGLLATMAPGPWPPRDTATTARTATAWLAMTRDGARMEASIARGSIARALARLQAAHADDESGGFGKALVFLCVLWALSKMRRRR